MNQNIINLFNQLVDKEGFTDTKIPGVKLYKTTIGMTNTPILYDNLLIFMIQGSKIIKISKETFEYDNKKYLVVPTTLPLEVESFASEENPMLSITIAMDKKSIFEIFDKMDFNEKRAQKSSHLGVFTDKITEDIEDAIYRLLKSLHSKNDYTILGEMIVKEIFYRIILGDESMFLHRLFLNTSVEAKISRTIKRIHDQYNEHLDIETLSKLEDMSASSFHSHFKRITSYSPKQYIKRLKLTKANEMLKNYAILVHEVATQIGYESIPQFSNDYKTYFGYTPKDTPKSYED